MQASSARARKRIHNFRVCVMESVAQVTLEEKLYFGSVEVRFEIAAGSLHNALSYREERTQELELLASIRTKPIPYPNEEKLLVIPAVPAIDLTGTPGTIPVMHCSYSQAMLCPSPPC